MTTYATMHFRLCFACLHSLLYGGLWTVTRWPIWLEKCDWQVFDLVCITAKASRGERAGALKMIKMDVIFSVHMSSIHIPDSHPFLHLF